MKGGINIFGYELTWTYFWIALAVIFAIVEAFTFSLATIWFSVGALVAMIASILGFSLIWQVFIFLVASAIFIYYTRPFFNKKLKVGTEKTNIDALIGEVGIVTEDIAPFETGIVKISGQIWTAKSANNQLIQRDSKVKVIKIEGVKIIVDLLNESSI